MAKKETDIEKAERVTKELREATREARGSLKDIHQLQKDLRTELDEFEKGIRSINSELIVSTREDIIAIEERILEDFKGFSAQLREKLRTLVESADDFMAELGHGLIERYGRNIKKGDVDDIITGALRRIAKNRTKK